MNRTSLAALLFVLLALPVHANLRRIEVKKGDATAKELGLSVAIARDKYSHIVTIAAREEGPLKSLFAAGLRVAQGPAWDIKSVTLDAPLAPKPPYATKPGYSISLRLQESMIRDATVYFRTGTPYSEVVYDIPLGQYLP